MPDTPPPAPLAGVFVLDLSRVLAGPYCTMVLGDLGARVVKVEAPGAGDVTRGWGPPFDRDGESAYFLAVNRNKESVVLDLRGEAGRRSLGILALRADVLVENFAPGALGRMGISIPDLRRENPRLIVASVTGFGTAGPERGRAGFDLLAQAGAGMMAVTGEPGGPPVKAGSPVSDLSAGLYLAIGILAALHRREATGEGSIVETNLFSATLAMLPNLAQACLTTGLEAARAGNAHPQIVPYQLFETADAPIVVAAGTDRQYRRLCERVLMRPELAADARCATNADRVRARAWLLPELERAFLGETSDTWLARLEEAGVPAGPVRGPLAALGSEQARAIGAVAESGLFRTVASPIAVAGATPAIRRPPRLGEHTEAIRREFGLP